MKLLGPLIVALVLFCNAAIAPAGDVMVPAKELFPDVKIEHEYDKFKDRETWSSTRIIQGVIAPEKGSVVVLSVTCWKKQDAMSETLAFDVATLSESWVNLGRFNQLRENEAIFMLDETRMTLPFVYDSDVSGKITDRYNCTEVHRFPLDIDEFVKIGMYPNIEAQIGAVQIRLSAEDRNWLQGFIAHLPREKFGSHTVKTDPASVEKAEAIAAAEAQKKRDAYEAEMIKRDLATIEEANKKGQAALRAIKQYLIGKNDSLAKKKLSEVLEKYPDTDAAKEASELLETLK